MAWWSGRGCKSVWRSSLLQLQFLHHSCSSCRYHFSEGKNASIMPGVCCEDFPGSFRHDESCVREDWGMSSKKNFVRQDSLKHPKREDLFQTFSTTNALGIYTFIKCSSLMHDILALSKYFLFCLYGHPGYWSKRGNVASSQTPCLKPSSDVRIPSVRKQYNLFFPHRSLIQSTVNSINSDAESGPRIQEKEKGWERISNGKKERGRGYSPAVQAWSACPRILGSSPVCIRQMHPLQTMATYVSIGTGAYG